MQKRFIGNHKNSIPPPSKLDCSSSDPAADSMSFSQFRDCVSRSLQAAGESAGMVGVMVLNVGRVKTVNGLLGYQAGDRLIAHAGSLLAEYAGSSRPVCRLYGDEFAVLLPELSGYPQLLAFAQGVSSAFAQPLQLGSHEWTVTISTGTSLFPNDGATVDALLYRAGIALRHAKEKGGNSQQIYHPDMPEVSLEDLDTENALRHSYENGEFSLHYQPAIRISDGKLAGMEALLRWNRPGRGLIPSLDFIHVAESCGMMVPIGTWALKEVCRQHLLWKQSGFGMIPVSVNISAAQLYQRDFVNLVKQVLEENAMEPNYLYLEIIESEALKHSHFIQETMNRLRKLGVRLIIDDYGTGFTSIGHLHELHIDAIKIDRRYVRDSVQDHSVRALVKALIDMSRSLNLIIIAEGVETAAQAHMMHELGCDYAQGYRFFPPLSLEVCESILQDKCRSSASFA